MSLLYAKCLNIKHKNVKTVRLWTKVCCHTNQQSCVVLMSLEVWTNKGKKVRTLASDWA